MSYQIHSMAFEFWGFDGMINEVGRFDVKSFFKSNMWKK